MISIKIFMIMKRMKPLTQGTHSFSSRTRIHPLDHETISLIFWRIVSLILKDECWCERLQVVTIEDVKDEEPSSPPTTLDNDELKISRDNSFTSNKYSSKLSSKVRWIKNASLGYEKTLAMNLNSFNPWQSSCTLKLEMPDTNPLKCWNNFYDHFNHAETPEMWN